MMTATLMLPLALGVTVPEVRWCGVDWSEVGLACAIAPEICRVASARCAGPGCTEAIAAGTCEEPPCGGPAGSSPCDHGVAAGDGRAAVACAAPACAPTAAAGLGAAHATPPVDESEEPAAGGRAYCIDDPPGAPTPRSGDEPVPDLAASAVAVRFATIPEPPRRDVARPDTGRAARPPTGVRAAIPPVRAPPRTETT